MLQQSIPSSSAGRLLPLNGRSQWVAAIALALLMGCTRGHHFATVAMLPSASWAVFFLLGALVRPAWALPLFFAFASALDIASLEAGTISDWCLSPAYWALVPTYALLWGGGRVYARLHDARWHCVPRLALTLVVSATLAYICSKGGFYFFSGHYPQADLAGFLARVPQYYPRALGPLAGYAAAGIALVTAWQRVGHRQPSGAAA